MKKKVVSVFMVLALVVLAASCGSAPAPQAAADPNTPPWLNDFPPEDVLWGIGSARQSTPQMSMTTAEARARVAIARQLDTKVQAMFTDYNLDAGPAGNQVSTSMQEDVSRQVTAVNLAGARPIQRWSAPDGTWWFLVEYRVADARNQIASILNNQEAQFAQFRAQQALDMLDTQLARSERPLLVDN